MAKFGQSFSTEKKLTIELTIELFLHNGSTKNKLCIFYVTNYFMKNYVKVV